METKVKGPILIFGAGGFIGINLLKKLLKQRDDVVGVSSNLKNSWRIKQNKIPKKNLYQGNLLQISSIKKIINDIKPKTIFNLAAYGAYSKQKDIEKIYQTNFISTVNLIEELKKTNFTCYLHAGSQSEYGLNAASPKEDDQLIPNSHYAVSKTATYYLLKYYGRVEKLPVVHLRFYSVYGPWEEPDRLIPTLIKQAKIGNLPQFVDGEISRDFIYIDDVIDACLLIAANLKKDYYGDVFNIATGKKTMIKELAFLTKKLFNIKKEPSIGSMKKRDWDVKNWWGNPQKMEKNFGWKAKISLKEGLKKTFNFYASLPSG
ncbi:MAG: NAD-dependent epimerase/dehydratase family protein [Microgenomates group bacterium]|nr:NAD-dependent epimerase/dehydratase family protein [Microgenomates group bacterium]